MILLIIIFLICPAVLLSVIFRLFLRQSPYPKSPTNLPPGSMGLPFLGETLQLYSHNPNVFFSSKQRRYGDIFKTRILGCPCIMIANPEAARFILVTQAHLFKPTFPPSKQGLVGHQALFFHDGAYHARLRRLVQSLFLPETIRGTVSDIEEICQTMLNSWEGRTINTYMEMRKYAFDVSLLMILRCQKGLDKEGLNDAFCTMEKGYNSMPIDFPGTKFSSATKARKHLSEIIRRIISERRRKGVVYPDLLGSLLKFEDENRMGLTNDQIVDNIVGVIFASRHTTASILIWLVKFLKDSPSVLEAVIAEHESIRQSKLASNPSLTWEDTKNMRLTSRVIQETLRVATILSFTFREAVEDVEYKGYVIPKGWKVMPLFRSIHHSPEFFPDPHKFDPSRFEV